MQSAAHEQPALIIAAAYEQSAAYVPSVSARLGERQQGERQQGERGSSAGASSQS